MSGHAPIFARWNGEALVPVRRDVRRCNETLVVDEVYEIDFVEPRHGAYERFFFAALREAYRNLPEGIAEEFGSVDEFRRYALIKTGWAVSNRWVLPSNKVAQDVLPVIQAGTEYAIVDLTGNVITRWVARSQKRREMGREDFEKSTKDVLDYAASLIGVDRRVLDQNAGAAA